MRAFLAIIAAIVAIVLFVYALSFSGLAFQRLTQPYAEETRRRTYENSAAHQEGVEQQIAAYCLNMRTAKAPGDKKAFASFITSEASTFNGEGSLSPETQKCIAEAQIAQATPANL